MAKKILTLIIIFAFTAKVSGQVEVDASNQVGIGTNNPQHKLHVVGNALVTGNLLLGSDSTFLGTTGNNPVIFKSNNVLSGSTGSSDKTNVSFGYEALAFLTVPTPGNYYNYIGNTAVGYRALRSNPANSAAGGNYNTAIGYNALYSNTTGSLNSAIGNNALYSNTTGINNIAIGPEALYFNMRGESNIAIGHYALHNNMNSHNIALGYGALRDNTEGWYNIAHGYGALCSNTLGNYNVAIGSRSLLNNTTGNYNVAYGSASLNNNTTGVSNTAIGYSALSYNTTGSNNTAIGFGSLINSSPFTLGSNNTAIGVHTQNLTSNGEVSNSTAIGYLASINSSNQVRIGNSYVSSIGGYAAWSNLSDRRIKRNIRGDVPGLAFINSLQPVTYNMDLDAVDELMKFEEPEIRDEDMEAPPPKSKELIEIERKAREAKEKQVQTGFVAQDVEKAAKGVGYDFSGVDVDETGIYSLRYAEFVVPLVKAVQELSEQNDRLQEQVKAVHELSEQNDRLQEKVKAVQELSEQNDRLQEQISELNRRLEALENK